MGLTYLDMTKSKVLAANGGGVISFAPDTGQYWLPTIVHVGTRNVSGSVAEVGLHSGGLPGSVDNVSLRDYTWFGNNDSSSVLAGSIVFPNSAIVIEFINGNPGDTAFATVIGMVSDEPPAIGIIPSIPGVRFAGSGNFIASGLSPWRPNRRPLGFFVAALGVGASSVLLAAVAGRQYYLHSAQVCPSNGFAAWSFQDTNGNDLGIYSDHQAGAPANVPIAPAQSVNWYGSPLDTGTGLRIRNLSGGAMDFSGHVTYGHYAGT